VRERDRALARAVSETDLVEQRVTTRGVDAVKAGVEADVLAGGQLVVEHRVVREYAQPAADRVGRRSEALTVESDAPLGRGRERGEYAD